MYNTIKNITKRLIPQRILFLLEPYFRLVFYFAFYRGNEHTCNICNKKVKSFLSPLQICPACGSLPRNRRLWQILNEEYLKKGITILDFSPSRCLYRKHKKNNYHYTSTDLSNNFIADKRYDITNIPVANNSYDLIICYHILEHVIDDKKAMMELLRTLKPNGTCLIQTPFKEGNIYEDYSITSPVDREKYFGQDDHVRWYSADGLQQRLTNIGFVVEALHFKEQPENIYGFDGDEIVLICTKPNGICIQ